MAHIWKPRTSRSALHKLDMHALFTIFTYTWYACEMQNIYDDLCEYVVIDYNGKYIETSPNEWIETDKFAILFGDMRFTRKNRRDDFQPCNERHAASVTYNITCYVLNDSLGYNKLGDEKLCEDIAGQPLLRKLPYGKVCEYNPEKSYAKIHGKIRYTITNYVKCIKIKKYETPLCLDCDDCKYFYTYWGYRTWVKSVTTTDYRDYRVTDVAFFR